MGKLYYFTLDELNANAAETLAGLSGVALELADPRDLQRLEREEADVILDWDYSPEEERQTLINSTAIRVIGAHGYSFSESVASFLVRRGIVCRSKLDEWFFSALNAKASAA